MKILTLSYAKIASNFDIFGGEGKGGRRILARRGGDPWQIFHPGVNPIEAAPTQMSDFWLCRYRDTLISLPQYIRTGGMPPISISYI